MASLNIYAHACAETDSANTSQVTNDSFDVGAFSRQVNESYAVFDLSSLPEGASVSKLKLRLRQKSGSYYKKSVTLTAAVCSNYISPSRIKWSSKPGISQIKGNLTISANENADRTWTLRDASGLGQYIFDGKLTVKIFAEGASAGDNNAKGFETPGVSDNSKKPRLTVEYDTPHGIKVFTQGSFTEKPVKVFTGGSWTEASVKYFDGNEWKN